MWEIVHAAGFAEDFISLVKGLLMPGMAKVHFNGIFTPRFQLQQGVRQGCYLAPLLYLLSTPPLMLFREHLQNDSLKGLDIGEGQQLLH
jgi:hypothetical protein